MRDEERPSPSSLIPRPSSLTAPVWDAPDLRALNELMLDPQDVANRPNTWGLHIDDLLRMATERHASDLHLSEGLPPMLRLDGRLVKMEFDPLRCSEIQRLVYDVLSNPQIQQFEKTHELDFSYGLQGVGRFRFNVYRQRNCVSAAMRAIPTRIPTIEELRLPSTLRDLVRRPSGNIRKQERWPGQSRECH